MGWKKGKKTYIYYDVNILLIVNYYCTTSNCFIDMINEMLMILLFSQHEPIGKSCGSANIIKSFVYFHVHII